MNSRQQSHRTAEKGQKRPCRTIESRVRVSQERTLEMLLSGNRRTVRIILLPSPPAA